MSTIGPPPPAPAPSEPLLRLRPLGLGEVLDDIFRIYRRHFGLLCAIGLLVSVPSLLIQFTTGSVANLGLLFNVFGNLGNPQSSSTLVAPALPNLQLLGLSYLVLLALLPFSIGAVSRAAIDIALGNPVSVRSAFAGVARRYWALLAQTLIVVVAILLLLLCFPVAIWIGVRWAVGIPAVLAEGIGPLRGLGRSWTLTRGSWWRLFGTLLLVYLLQAVISGALGVLGLPLGFAIPFVPPVVRAAIVLTVSTAAGALTMPVVYLCIVLLYFDLRIRREHFDLDQLARQAVAPPAPG
jgi:hypothetical protein